MMQANHELCFHVSENATIQQFEPRADATGKPVVWAIDARHLANYLLPRECPRICVRVEHASQLERVPPLLARVGHTIVVETAWARVIAQTDLTVYAFSRRQFSVVDANAGYLQATTAVEPLSADRLRNLPAQLAARGSVLQFAESLWPIHDWVSTSTHEFSCIRMRNAAARGAG